MLKLSREWLLVWVMVAFASACSQTPPEQALRAAVAGMAQAVEARNASGVLQHLAANFRAQSAETGELDRDSAKRTLTGILLAYPNIKLGTTIRELKVEGNTARMLVEVVAGGGAGALPDNVRHFSFTLDWAKDGGDWKLTRAQWER
jgi:ketosteroid isomerase-like protein